MGGGRAALPFQCGNRFRMVRISWKPRISIARAEAREILSLKVPIASRSEGPPCLRFCQCARPPSQAICDMSQYRGALRADSGRVGRVWCFAEQAQTAIPLLSKSLIWPLPWPRTLPPWLLPLMSRPRQQSANARPGEAEFRHAGRRHSRFPAKSVAKHDRALGRRPRQASASRLFAPANAGAGGRTRFTPSAIVALREHDAACPTHPLCGVPNDRIRGLTQECRDLPGIPSCHTLEEGAQRADSCLRRRIRVQTQEPLQIAQSVPPDGRKVIV